MGHHRLRKPPADPCVLGCRYIVGPAGVGWRRNQRRRERERVRGHCMRVTPLQRERARKDTAPDGTELLADGRVRVLSNAGLMTCGSGLLRPTCQ